MENDYSKLTELISCSDQDVIQKISYFFEHLDTDRMPVITDNYMYLDMMHPICFVAHIDTLRSSDNNVHIQEKNGIMRNINGILGADDRAGVYAVIEIANHCALYGNPIPSILFCNYEEIGRIGVESFVKSGHLNTEGLHLFLEYDRRGKNDFVSYQRSLPSEVESYLRFFGYQKSFGSVSDVAVLMEHTDIPAANLSIGFYNEHTSREYLCISEMEDNINRGLKMCNSPIDKLYRVPKSLNPYWC